LEKNKRGVGTPPGQSFSIEVGKGEKRRKKVKTGKTCKEKMKAHNLGHEKKNYAQPHSQVGPNENVPRVREEREKRGKRGREEV